ncbi:MAG: methyltransferase domain-containing protein, partial [Bacteroidales bacterium]|nr:methyltransferase domain-containing protein [Bacteroidales bacterium]
MTTNNQLSTKQFPENYFVEKYGLSPTHSEVLAATPYFVGERALDIGCGRGRNAFYLAQHGYQVDAYDANPHAIDIIEHIIEIEGLDSVHA